jgi:hypothetical protein
MWNEPNAGTRRAAIAKLWAPDGACLSKSLEARGYEALDERVRRAHERWVAGAGYRFYSTGDANGHHNIVRFHWKMAAPGAVEAESTGQDIFLLDGQGRIAVAYQFVDS